MVAVPWIMEGSEEEAAAAAANDLISFGSVQFNEAVSE